MFFIRSLESRAGSERLSIVAAKVNAVIEGQPESTQTIYGAVYRPLSRFSDRAQATVIRDGDAWWLREGKRLVSR